MQEADWRDLASFGMLLDGRAQTTGIRQRGHEATLLLMINAHHDAVKFAVPSCPGCCHWVLLIDTNVEGEPDPLSLEFGAKHEMPARSLQLFTLESENGESKPAKP
jgi:glycogen operon protein